MSHCRLPGLLDTNALRLSVCLPASTQGPNPHLPKSSPKSLNTSQNPGVLGVPTDARVGRCPRGSLRHVASRAAASMGHPALSLRACPRQSLTGITGPATHAKSCRPPLGVNPHQPDTFFPVTVTLCDSIGFPCSHVTNEENQGSGLVTCPHCEEWTPLSTPEATAPRTLLSRATLAN